MSKRAKRVVAVVIIWGVCLGGCGFNEKQEYSEILENHRAIALWHDGVWDERYSSLSDLADGIVLREKVLQLSIDVESDMSDADIREVMDYYQCKYNAKFDTDGKYAGQRDTDYTCYVAFYRGKTNEEIDRFKYKNGEFVELGEGDEGRFALPDAHNSGEGEGDTEGRRDETELP